MAFVYTMGINFDQKESAELCKIKFENYPIILSDSTVVRIMINVNEDYSGKFYLDIYPIGLQYVVGNKKIASRKFFYEIRTILYNFLFDVNLNFNCAFFELEGADILNIDDIITILNDFGIGDLTEGDSNAASLTGANPLDYESKRLYDGLIVSNVIYNAIIDKSLFVQFKKGYMWLPIKL